MMFCPIFEKNWQGESVGGKWKFDSKSKKEDFSMENEELRMENYRNKMLRILNRIAAVGRCLIAFT